MGSHLCVGQGHSHAESDSLKWGADTEEALWVSVGTRACVMKGAPTDPCPPSSDALPQLYPGESTPLALSALSACPLCLKKCTSWSVAHWRRILRIPRRAEFKTCATSVLGVYVDTLLLSTPPDHLSQGHPQENPASLGSTFAATPYLTSLVKGNSPERPCLPWAPSTIATLPSSRTSLPPGFPNHCLPEQFLLHFLSLCSLLITSRHQNPSPSPSGWFLSQGWPSAQAPFPSKPQGGPAMSA